MYKSLFTIAPSWKQQEKTISTKFSIYTFSWKVDFGNYTSAFDAILIKEKVTIRLHGFSEHGHSN